MNHSYNHTHIVYSPPSPGSRVRRPPPTMLIAGSYVFSRQKKSNDDRANVILLILPQDLPGNISNITLAQSSWDFVCLNKRNLPAINVGMAFEGVSLVTARLHRPGACSGLPCPVPACGRLVGAGSGSRCGEEFGRSRTGKGSSGGRNKGVV